MGRGKSSQVLQFNTVLGRGRGHELSASERQVLDLEDLQIEARAHAQRRWQRLLALELPLTPADRANIDSQGGCRYIEGATVRGEKEAVLVFGKEKVGNLGGDKRLTDIGRAIKCGTQAGGYFLELGEHEDASKSTIYRGLKILSPGRPQELTDVLAAALEGHSPQLDGNVTVVVTNKDGRTRIELAQAGKLTINCREKRFSGPVYQIIVSPRNGKQRELTLNPRALRAFTGWAASELG